MRNHLRILGWLYVVVCGLLLAVGLTLCALLALDPSASSQKALQFLAPPILFVSGFGLMLGLAGGIGLLCSQRWARTVLLILSVFLLLLLPLGTALAGYTIWVLRNAEVQTHSDGSQGMTAKPIMPEMSPLVRLLGVMACVAAGFFLVLKIGFILHNDPQPEPIANNSLTAVAVLVLLAGMAAAMLSAVRFFGDTAANARSRREAQANFSWHMEARRLRVAELSADPARARYAPLVERGEEWSDEDITYYENPQITTTCEHLQAIERAMRRAGVQARRYRETDVTATCCIDLPALQRAFEIALPVRYAEFFQGDRDSHEHPAALLICDEHKSMIYMLHPDECPAGTPLFPAAEG